MGEWSAAILSLSSSTSSRCVGGREGREVEVPVEAFLAGCVPYQLESVQAYSNGMVWRHCQSTSQPVVVE